MCGIAGIFSPNAPKNWDAIGPVLQSMTDAIAHRGPNAEGHHIEPHVALGHRRLSIIDVATGIQPLFNEDGSVSVVFNGEIYNYLDLVMELEALGHVFRTRSDTEVIVHGWEQWGTECVTHFRGMFAFALWDRNTKTFFMARDRMGVKPIYYGFDKDGTLYFGSEIKAILQVPNFPRDFDDTAIEDYFSSGYVPEPKSIYKHVKKLSSAHYLISTAGQVVPRIAQYWDVRFNPTFKGTESDMRSELLAHLDESVRIRLMSEVPLGAFLSGGVDSSAVVAMMAKHSSGPVKTCSIAFDVPAFDESEYAKQVAIRYATDHNTTTITGDDHALIDTLVNCYDEPYADSSAIPTYRVCQIARQRVTVALSGDGGDETFGGYRRYRFHVAEEKLRSNLPFGVRSKLFGTLGRAYPKLDWAPRIFRAKATLQGLSLDPIAAYARAVSFVREADRSALYTQAFKSRITGYDTLDAMRAHGKAAQTDDPLSLIQYIDYKTYLPGDINVKVDRASMAHSLEVREPLMDHRLIEWAATLPSSVKLRNGEGKYIFKKSLEPLLSDDILYRNKMGFAIPLSDWFKGPLKDEFKRVINCPPMRSAQIIDAENALKMLDEHTKGKRDRSTILWTLLMFAKFIEFQAK